MDTKRILAELNAERERLDKAIAAIEGITPDGATRATTAPQRRPRSRMSTAARKRLSALLKKRWAEGKMRGKAKARPKVSTRRARPRFSAAARKRLSQLMKARWASGKMKGRSKAKGKMG